MWSVSKGTHRTVIAIPTLGIAIKWARIQSWPLRNFYGDLTFLRREMWPNPDPKVRKLFWETVRSSANRAVIQFFEGFSSNWRERTYYKHADASGKLLLQPTYLTFFGVFNVQKYGEPADEADSDEMYRQFHSIAGKALIRDGHHWSFADNFHVHTDGLKILDYGNVATQQIIDEFGAALYARFQRK
jgi:hypothetical protein